MKSILNDLKKKTLLKKNTLWKSSPFEYLVTSGLSPDDKGKFGENFIHELIKKYTTYTSVWMGNENTGNSDGSIYDILINSKRTEVKTATSGIDRKRNKLNYTFQHENIYKEYIWDKLIFLDIEPAGFYITIINHTDMVFGNDKHPIFNKKATKHLSAWKFDMSRSSLKKGIENNITLYVSFKNIDSCEDTISKFLNNNFI